MKTLLIHALKSEAGMLKQYFPGSSIILSLPGTEQCSLDQNFDLLRTGVGLKRTQSALENIHHPEVYEQVIHFGVSGSLAAGFPIYTLILGSQFFKANGAPIVLNAPVETELPGISSVAFYSCLHPVTDELSRTQAASSGAQAVDMESYAVAEFCRDNHLPLLALRCISDRAGLSTSKDFSRNYKRASQKLQEYILKDLLKR